MATKKLTRYFQHTSNKVLDVLAKEPDASYSDRDLAEAVNVSMNLIQRVLLRLKVTGVAMKKDGSWQLVRRVRKSDYFDLGEGELSQGESVDNYCITQFTSGRFAPGARISELMLAREARVST